MAENEIDKFMEDQRAQMKTASAPSVSLPDTFDDPNLKPRFSDTPEKQLNEYKVRLAAQAEGVDPHVAAAVALKESGFNPDAVSPTGVRGLMQVSGVAAKDLGLDPSQVRNNPDMNIQAGVKYLAKHGLAKYPDPAVRDSYVKDVLNHAETSRASTHNDKFSSIEDEIKNAPETAASAAPEPTANGVSASSEKPGPTLARLQGAFEGTGANFISKKLGLDKARAYLDKHVPDIDQLMTSFGIDPAKKYDPETKTFIHDPNYKAPVSSDELHAASEKDIAASVAAHPGNYKLSKVLGFMVGPGKLISAATPAVASGLASAGLQGATAGAGFESLTDPKATPGSVGKSAVVGAATGGLIHGAASGLAAVGKGFGRALINFATKAGDNDVADYVSSNFGPTISKSSLLTKNQNVLNETEKSLQKVLSSGENAAKTVDVGDKVLPDDILKIAIRKANAGLREDADTLVNMAQKLEEGKGKLSLSDANELKRVLWKESKFKTSGDPSVADAAQFAYKAGVDIMKKIEGAAEGPVRNLNQTLSSGIRLQNSLNKPAGLASKLRTYAEIGAAIKSGGTAIPAIAAERLATGVPGATTVGSAVNAASNAPDISPALEKLLGAIMPQLFNK